MISLFIYKDEFMRDEWNNVYIKLFDSYEEYKRLMEYEIERCSSCKSLYWKNSGKRCLCDDKKLLDKDNSIS